MCECIHTACNRTERIADNAKGVILGAYTALMLAPYSVFCGGSGFLNGSMTEISVNADVSAQSVVNRIVTIIAGLFIIVGLLKTATSAFGMLEAYSEDNSAAMTKHTKQLGIGVAFIASPFLITWLLS
ncbi:MAG: hypothetical protein LUE86_01320 [Clostridiales bacterium]|nr:hypothetical protein [Clostridiales bacterium]